MEDNNTKQELVLAGRVKALCVSRIVSSVQAGRNSRWAQESAVVMIVVMRVIPSDSSLSLVVVLTVCTRNMLGVLSERFSGMGALSAERARFLAAKRWALVW